MRGERGDGEGGRVRQARGRERERENERYKRGGVSERERERNIEKVALVKVVSPCGGDRAVASIAMRMPHGK